jgi:hypothetical protein
VTHECHPLLHRHVEIVDVKVREDMSLIGRTGMILHDEMFDADYVSFDDGGSVDPRIVIVELLVEQEAQ